MAVIPFPSKPLAPEARCLGARALDFRDGLRRARRQHLAAVGGDEHVVFDAHADAAVALGHRVEDLRGLRLLFFLDLLRGGDAEAVAALPLLLFAVLAQVER